MDRQSERPGTSHGGTSRLDAGINWLYTRFRTKYLWILVAITAAAVECAVPLLVLIIGPVFGGGRSTILSIMVPASMLGIPTLWWVVRTHHASAVAYLRGDDPGPPPDEVWRSSVAELAYGVFLIVCGYWVPLTAGAILTGVMLGSGALLTAVFCYAVTVSAALLGSLFFLVWEAALRPLARELAPRLSADILVDSRGPSISMKLFILLTTISLFNGFAVGSVALIPRSHDARAAVAALTSVAVSIGLAATVITMLRRSFVTRIDEIRGALDLVESGKREDVTLAPLAGDELDEVTDSFNGMVRQLEQREEDMRDSRARIVAVADSERRRMERDLHDGAQQYMALIGLQLSNHAENVASDPNLRAEVEELQSTLAAAQAELRNLAHGIYPATLETEGLAPAIREAAGRATVPVTVTSDGVTRLARDVEAALYFCCLEALQNVGKYAGPDATVRVTLSRIGSRINFAVSDDGVGFNVAAHVHGHGLTNMQDRIGALGGEIAVTSVPDEGTTVTGWVPTDAIQGMTETSSPLSVEEEPPLRARISE